MNEEQVRKAIVYNVIHGSRAYGTNIPGSDADEKGIAIIPYREQYFGFSKFEQKDGGWEDGNDRVIYDIRKFFRLALTCNPNIIEILYVDEPQILQINPSGAAIRAMRDSFLSRSAAKTFTGYACAQMKRLKAKIAKKEEINWKHAMHLLRLLRMGKEIVKDGDVLVRRPDREYLIKVRMGQVCLKDIFDESDELLAEIDSLVARSPLPEKPDRDMAEILMMELIVNAMRRNREI